MHPLSFFVGLSLIMFSLYYCIDDPIRRGSCTSCGKFHNTLLYCPISIGCLEQYPPVDCHCQDLSPCRVDNECNLQDPPAFPNNSIQQPRNETTRLWLKACNSGDPRQHFDLEQIDCLNNYDYISWASDKQFNVTVQDGILEEGVPIILDNYVRHQFAQKWLYNNEHHYFSPLGNPNMCMTAYNSQNLTLLRCEIGKSAQKWYLQRVNLQMYKYTKTYQIVSISASECLSALDF